MLHFCIPGRLIRVIAEYHLHLDNIYKGFLPTLRAKQGITDEDCFVEDFGFGWYAADWAGEEVE